MTNKSPREVIEGTQPQGIDEQIAYTITSTPWGSSPTSITVAAYDITVEGTRTDVTSTVLSGSASAVGDVITTPYVKSLTVDHTYRIEVKFTVSGNIVETYFIIKAEY